MNKYILSAFLMFLIVCIDNVSVASDIRQSLIGDDWIFGQARLNRRYPASVPGVVHTDLMANGVIDDPFVGLNERGVQWVDKEDWIYIKDFIADDTLLEQNNIDLVFDGLDTYADVFLNDSLVLTADNMFRIWKADVKPLLRKNNNILKVLFHSPIATDMPKWEALPNQYRASNDQSENGGVFERKLSVFARKAGYHYGWDWGPRLVTSGIWRSVYLEGWSDARIDNVYVRQHKVTAKNASISNEVEIASDCEMKDVVVSVTDSISGNVMGIKKCNLHRGINRVTVDFVVKNPRLWWCHNIGKPELYTFTTSVKCPNGQNLQHSERIGLRSVEIITDPDEEGTMQFYVKLNGVPVFAKGTNYIPQDNFLPRVSRDRYESAVADAVAANMNMIRIWGGGIYEDKIFYDLCDEQGIMVWQDFMFACSMYPAAGDWIENVKMEARDNLIRLRNHPSIVLWCGGNECLDAWYNWGWKGRHEKIDKNQAIRMEEEMNTQYFEALPQMMECYAPDSFYWANSPFSGKGKGSDGLNGDRHYYGVWQRKHPISQYNQEKSHFFSEYGVQSFPEYSTVMKYASDTETHHMESDVMMWHQRGGENANALIGWYLENEYRKPKDFKEMLYLNQVFQADAMRTAIESHRRNMPYCMGSLLWQHDDCWPVASWSTRDYYGKWKAAHYMIRRAFDNIIATPEITSDSIYVYVVSDLIKRCSGTLGIKLYDLNGNTRWTKTLPVEIHPNTSSKVWSVAIEDILEGADPTDVVINLGITADKYFHDGNYYLCKQSELHLKKRDIDYEIHPTESGYEVKLSSNGFVRALYLTVQDEAEQFDDNYFDLLPGQTRICKINTSLSPSEFEEKLQLTSLYI